MPRSAASRYRPDPLRRHVLAVAGALGLLVFAGCGSGAAPAAGPYDWGVAYYMSYDNDLESFGQHIIAAIRAGVAGPNTVAAVQADFEDSGGMRRYAITSGGLSETVVPSEDSADEEQAANFLEWFAQTYPCRRYAVVFLDHGGWLDEMCRDDHPGASGKEWMSGATLGERLRAWKAGLPGRWELLFLQQCGRATLENLYSFRGTADYVLASPTWVGAPNSYYPNLHRWLAANPSAGGLAVASEIAQADADYTIYTCVRGAALDELPIRVNAALAPILALPQTTAAARPADAYTAAGEGMVDAGECLTRLAAANGAGAAEAQALVEWLEGDLTAGLWRHTAPLASGPSASGLALFWPRAATDVGKYAHLGLYRETRLPELWGRLVSQ